MMKRQLARGPQHKGQRSWFQHRMIRPFGKGIYQVNCDSMVLLLFSCLDPNGYYHECTFGGFGVEVGFEMLTALVRDGWQLESVKLLGNASPPVSLPIAAFDGQPFLEPIANLEKEWKSILTINKT